MAKTVGKIAGIVAGVALIATGIGAALGGTMVLTAFGATIAASTIATVAGAISLGAGLLAGTPKVKASPASTDRLRASLDTRAYRKIVFGRTATAVDVRYQEFTGSSQEYLNSIIALASHELAAIEEIWFDDKLAWSSAGGVQSAFTGYLTVTTRTVGTAANALTITGSSSWTSGSSRFVGNAYIWLQYKLTGNSKKADSPFASGVTSRITVRGKGAKLYDPRQDSTQGGSGSQRATDQTTWGWTSDTVGRNPALQLLWYLLGWQIQNPVTSAWKLAVGLGIPVARIDLASFIAAANLCDEAVSLAGGGTEPRYRADGVFSEGDDPATVFENLLATMNGVLRDAGGKLALEILHNDLGTPVVDLTAADVIDEFSWLQSPAVDQTFNVVRGRYVDPSDAALYQMADYPDVTIASPDGIERAKPFDMPMVQSASQAQRLAKTALQRAQYPGTFSAEFLASAWRCQVGSIVRLTFPALGFSNKLFRVLEHTIRFDGRCPMVLREENAAIYAWSAEETAAVQAAAPITYNPLNDPLVQGIGDAGGTAIWSGITGSGKPDDYATASDNAVLNAGMPVDAAYWNGDGSRQAAGSGDPAPFWRFNADGGVANLNGGAARPIPAGTTTANRSAWIRSNGAGCLYYFHLYCYDAAGNFLGSFSDIVQPGVANTWVLKKWSLVNFLAGTATFQVLAQVSYNGATQADFALPRVAPTEYGSTRNQYYVTSSDPGGSDGSLWKDTSLNPPKFKLKVSGAWVDVSNLVTDTSQLADGASLGLTAQWANIVGQSNAPENNATRNQYFVGTSDPGGSNGSLWKDTSTTPARFKLKVGGTWTDVSSLVTDTAQLTDGAQLGLTAVWTGISGSGKPENNADVTWVITGPTLIEIEASSAGVPIAAQLPKVTQFRVNRGGTDITTSVAWSVSTVGGTFSSSIGAATGAHSLNTSGGVITAGKITVTAVYNGVTKTYPVEIKRNDAVPTVGGGSGGGSGGSGVTGSISGSVSSTTPVVISTLPLVGTGSAGQVDLTASVEFSSSSNLAGSLRTRWQRKIGGVWTDIGSAKAEDVAYFYDSVDNYTTYGELSHPETITGLGANVTGLEFRLTAYLPSGTITRSVWGSTGANGG